jgi:hypothetical protein
MPEPSWPNQVDLAAYVVDVQTGQVKLRMPAPVVVLASDLLKGVSRRVATRNASELVAALLVRSARDRDALPEIIGDYRETLTHEILATAATEGFVELPARREVELT